jgi:hypothetical protein
MSSPRFFLLGPRGFARFQAFESASSGLFHVRSASEKNWVEAGTVEISALESDIASGRLVEFSPASLMGSVSSPAKSRAARANGSLGGRPPGKKSA